MATHLNNRNVSSMRFTGQGDDPMKGYLYVVEVKRNKEYVPYVARKRKEDAELVKANNEKYSVDQYRVRKYVRRLE